MRRSYHIYLFIFCVLMNIAAQGQSSYHINTAESMNTLMLTSVIKDRNDNMWVGSYAGLYKHEGSRIRAFNKIGSDNRSISGGEMHALFEDRLGFIWIGTTNGVDKIHPRTYEVRHYALRSTDSASSYVGYVYCIFQDKDDNIWASTDAALFKLNYGSGKYVTIPVRKDGTGIPSPTTSYKSAVSTAAGIWMRTGEGVVFYDYASKQFHHRYHNPHNDAVFALKGKGQGNQSDLCLDGGGNLWFINDSTTLMRYHLQSKRLDSFRFPFPRGAWRCCYSVTVDYKSRVWLGFRHGGLLIFDPAAQTFSAITTATVGRLLQSDYIYSLQEDYRHRMWVSTHNGLDIIDLDNDATRRIFLSNEEKFRTLSYEMITPTTDGDSLLYLPFYRYGFMQVNLHTDSIRSYRLTDSGAAGTTYVIPRNAATVWAARDKTLVPYSLAEKKVVAPFGPKPIADSVLDGSGDIIWRYANDTCLLYRTNRNGVFYRSASGLRSKTKAHGFKKNLCLSPDSTVFWYLTYDLNLVRRNLRTGDTALVPLQKKLKMLDFSFSNPRNIVDDGESVWMTGQNGMLRYNHASEKLSAYTVESGLAHSFTFSLCLAAQRNVWVGSLGGIDVYDRATDKFRSIISHPTETYMDAFGEALLIKDKLYFISGNKLFMIDPVKALSKPAEKGLRLLIQEVMVNGQAVDWKEHGLEKLSYADNRLLFRFGALDFTKEAGVKYFYYLEGLENDWIENRVPGEVSYNALSAKSYIFHVKVTDAFGKALSEDVTLAFTLAPPFWERWWFRVLMALLLVAAGYWFYKRRVNKIEREAAVRQQVTELESKALRAQMNPHFIFNSLNAIQELVVTKNIDAAYDYLSRFSKLLRQVLNNSEKPLIPLSDELGMLRLYLELESLRFRSAFVYAIDVEESLDAESLLVPPLLLQPFIENALWHGLMLKEGEKRLQIALAQKSSRIICTIEDNGIGRQKAQELKAQRLGAAHLQSKGMELSKQRISLLRQSGTGTAIKVEDLYENGAACGTRVVITLPLQYN